MAMMVLIVLNVVVHLILPPAFVAWVAFSRTNSRLYWIMVAITTFSFLVILHVVGAAWAWFGLWLPWVFEGLFFLALLRFCRRRWAELPWLPPREFKSWAGVAFITVGALFSASSLPGLVGLRSYEGEPLQLQWPLPEGTSFISHGGDSELLNAHHRVHAQRYALDVIQLNGFGVRARGVVPGDLAAYEIWGAPVRAPCAGEVLARRDALADQPVMEMDRDHILGNYVTLFCEDATILIAHLQQNTVAVEVGERVLAGDLIGKVGNTGNTSEPHLHIHAVRGRVTDLESLASTAEPVPMIYEGRFYIRGDRREGEMVR